jgi:hypothetical protein
VHGIAWPPSHPNSSPHRDANPDHVYEGGGKSAVVHGIHDQKATPEPINELVESAVGSQLSKRHAGIRAQQEQSSRPTEEINEYFHHSDFYFPEASRQSGYQGAE